MDRIFATVQLVLTALMSLCAIATAATQIILGHVTSAAGYLVCIFFVCLSLGLLRLSYKEYKEER